MKIRYEVYKWFVWFSSYTFHFQDLTVSFYFEKIGQKLINPVYCGYVSFSTIEFEEPQLVKGIHEPIVTEKLFFDVQNVIDTKRKIVRRNHEANEMFILHRYLRCANCNCKLRGSFSTGRSKKYPYYHCKASCKTRFRADNINSDYVERLKKIKLSKGALQLLELILKDTNANTLLDECLNERASILKQLTEQECLIDKSRKLFLNDKIEFDDFSKLKKEYIVLKKDLTDQLEKSTRKLNSINKQLDSIVSFKTIFSGFSDLNLNDKKHIIHFISPGHIDVYGNFILRINNSLPKILSMKSNDGLDISAIADIQALPANHNFKDRKVSIRKAINILAKNNIDTNENDANVILDFLYLIAKSSKFEYKTVPVMVKEKSNRQNMGQHQFLTTK